MQTNEGPVLAISYENHMQIINTVFTETQSILSNSVTLNEAKIRLARYREIIDEKMRETNGQQW